MKVLVTGGDGFVGKAIKNELEKKYDTMSISRRTGIDLEKGSLNDFRKPEKFDFMVHAAAGKGRSRSRVEPNRST